MVTSVNTNVNAMAAVQSLNDISNNMTMTQSHIQSGLKVAGAGDNPAVFTIAQGLRGNVKALTAVSDSLSTGLATLKAQISGATAISDALNTLKQTVTQGQGQTGNALIATNTTITNALTNIDAYATNSTINGVNLLSAGATLSVVSDISGGTTSATTAAASNSSGLGLTGLAVTTGGTTLTAVQGTAIASGDTVSVTDANNNVTVFEFNDGGSAIATQPVAGTVAAGVTSGSTKVVVVSTVTGATTNNDGQNMSNLLTAMKANGVAATIDNSGTITVGGSGTVAASALTTGTPSTNNAIQTVDAAIATIGATLSTLGAAALQLQGLSDFSSKLSDSTSTSLGAIVDANLSEESAKLASLQTKQSLAIQSLSLANQGPGALLQLFR